MGKMREVIRRNPWSMVSMLITVGDAVVIYALINYLCWRGLWTVNWRAREVLSAWGGLALLCSFVTGIIALARGESPAYSILAVCLSVLSFFFYVQ